mmetsp:Transcript_4539/g.8110  ORF Transcript_4539/g.8110 Transcript_4539/m.8110 type:complete len:91 (+) Transcript_4539:1388-1660(+)
MFANVAPIALDELMIHDMLECFGHQEGLYMRILFGESVFFPFQHFSTATTPDYPSPLAAPRPYKLDIHSKTVTQGSELTRKTILYQRAQP